MQLVYDLTTQKFYPSLSGTVAIGSLDLKRRDRLNIDLQARQNGSFVTLSGTGSLGLKKANNFRSAYIASVPTWTNSGTTYTFDLNLNTSEIDALFTSSSSSSSFEPENIPAMLEINWTSGTTATSTSTLKVTIHNDVIRGDEGPLAAANVTYPLATNILTKTGNLGQISDVPSARINLGVYSQTQSDQNLSAHTSNTSNPHSTTKAQVGLGNADNTSDLNKPISTATQTALNLKANSSDVTSSLALKLDASKVGAASGVASLDSGGKVPANQLPSTVMDFQGVWNASTNTPALSNGTGTSGDVYNVSVAGTVNFGAGATSFLVGDWVLYNGSIWEKSQAGDGVRSVAGRTGSVTLTSADLTNFSSAASAAAPVQSVSGRTGSVTLTSSDVGLGNVNNTSDSSKPVSTATQTALDAKANQTDLTATNAAVALKRNIYSGTADPVVAAGYQAGDYFFRTDTGKFFGPYSGSGLAGSWPTGLSLIGPANTLTASVTGVNYGTAPTASVTGTSPNQVLGLNFAVPKFATTVGVTNLGSSGTPTASVNVADPLNPILNLSLVSGPAGTGTTTLTTSNFTGATGVTYITSGTLVATDPTVSTGATYVIFVTSGSVTFAGENAATIYGPSRLPLVRYCNGTSWSTLSSNHATSITASGNISASGFTTNTPALTINDVASVAIASNVLALPLRNDIEITGTGPISSFTGGVKGATYTLTNKSASAIVLTHGASTIVCPGAANTTLEVGSSVTLRCDSSTLYSLTGGSLSVFNSNNITAPSQTAASDSSVMTRLLVDQELYLCPSMSFNYASGSTSGSGFTSSLTQGGLGISGGTTAAANNYSLGTIAYCGAGGPAAGFRLEQRQILSFTHSMGTNAWTCQNFVFVASGNGLASGTCAISNSGFGVVLFGNTTAQLQAYVNGALYTATVGTASGSSGGNYWSNRYALVWDGVGNLSLYRSPGILARPTLVGTLATGQIAGGASCGANVLCGIYANATNTAAVGTFFGDFRMSIY